MKFTPIKSLKSFWEDSKRIFAVSYKPTSEEFNRTLKVVLLGTIILGLLGFVISIIIGLLV